MLNSCERRETRRPASAPPHPRLKHFHSQVPLEPQKSAGRFLGGIFRVNEKCVTDAMSVGSSASALRGRVTDASTFFFAALALKRLLTLLKTLPLRLASDLRRNSDLDESFCEVLVSDPSSQQRPMNDIIKPVHFGPP